MWLETLGPEPRLRSRSLELLQTGCFYVLGRDRFYRPCYVMNGRILADVAKARPDLLEPEVFTELYGFFFHYMRRVMLLPGHVQ